MTNSQNNDNNFELESLLNSEESAAGTAPQTEAASSDGDEFVRTKSPEYMYVVDRSSKHRKGSRRRRKRRKRITIIIIILLLLIFALVGSVVLLNYLGKKDVYSGGTGDITAHSDAVVYNDGKAVTYKGKNYEYNENIITIACFGVDKEKLGTQGDQIGSGGQADAIFLVTIDFERSTANIVNVPRDIMTDVDLFSSSGNYIGNERKQLCLAYSYGDGKKTSAENLVSALSRIFYGMPINTYVAMDLSGIAALNDAIGGVDLVAIETIGEFTNGKPVHLKGKSAQEYVRLRKQVDTDANLLRMERQKQYIDAYASKAFDMVKKDITVVNDLYSTASNYVYTNLNLNKTVYLATNALTKGMTSFGSLTVAGEMIVKEPYPEFIQDEDALYEMVLGLFYNVVED